MKKFPQALALVLAAATLFFTACAKKPVRTEQTAAQTGPTTETINPDQPAIGTTTTEAPTTTLQHRDLPPGVIQDGDFLRGLVESVYFDFDRSAVKASEKPKVEAAVKYLKENADKHMVLEGHCDWRGTAEYNLGLGDRRATAVKKYLEALGVDSKRLEILSKGSTDAKKDGGDKEWAKDRRVDFLVLNRQ